MCRGATRSLKCLPELLVARRLIPVCLCSALVAGLCALLWPDACLGIRAARSSLVHLPPALWLCSAPKGSACGCCLCSGLAGCLYQLKRPCAGLRKEAPVRVLHAGCFASSICAVPTAGASLPAAQPCCLPSFAQQRDFAACQHQPVMHRQLPLQHCMSTAPSTGRGSACREPRGLSRYDDRDGGRYGDRGGRYGDRSRSRDRGSRSRRYSTLSALWCRVRCSAGVQDLTLFLGSVCSFSAAI